MSDTSPRLGGSCIVVAAASETGEGGGGPRPRVCRCSRHGAPGHRASLAEAEEIARGARGGLECSAMPVRTRDLRVESIRPLLPPAILLEELPLRESAAVTVSQGRDEVARILRGDDDRLIVIVGPCSIYDPRAAIDYAQRLRRLADDLTGELRIVMRVYFEKPRTTVGWKGLINDPNLDGSFAINEGLRVGRPLLLELAELGLPAGCEFLDPITPQFTSDLVTWGAIGARTTESQVHRELASACSMPVGFKNGTDGGVQIAIDAIRAAAHPHR